MIKETIILAPGANKTELLRSLALYGQGSFGMRIYSSAYRLAENMLIRKGIHDSNVFSDAEASYLISKLMKSIDAFKNSSFTDAVNMAASLRSLRNLITDDEASQMNKLVTDSEFSDKNRNLLEVYEKYRTALQSRKDSIDVIREALKVEYDLNVRCIRLKEFPLTPLEEALINKISENKTEEISLLELFGVEKKDLQNIRYVKAYGNSNEVENTLNYIFENDLPLDDCVIAVTDNRKYNQLLLEYSQKYQLDVIFARGTSITNNNPARLLKMYYQWDRNGYHGVDPLMEMLLCSSFDLEKLQEKISKDISSDTLVSTIDRAGQLKFEPDARSNLKKAEDYLAMIGERDRVDGDVLVVLAEELGKDCCSFLSEYSVITGEKDREALRMITGSIEPYLFYNPEGSYTDIYRNVLSLTVGKSVSSSGSLIVTDIRGALSCVRRNLFIIGLSAVNFPGNVRENYLLLDDDLKLYGDVETSEQIIERKKKELNDLIELYSSVNAQITLSYSGYDMTGIKDENASSVLFEIYSRQFPDRTIEDFEKLLKENEAAYLQNRLSLSHQVLNALSQSETIPEIPKGDIVNQPYDGNRFFSPSALETFFQCPKRFYLTRILGIEEPDPDDPFEVINARDMGTLVHSAMEYLAEKKEISVKDFLSYASDLFDSYLKTRTALSEDSIKAARKEFLNMVESGWRYDPRNDVVAAEERFSVMHRESGIGLYGLPDRVEVDKNGEYLIADFKTKRRIEHIPDDIDTCLQVVLYAYMMSNHPHNKYPISYCAYRYLRYRDPIICKYDHEIQQQLNEKLQIVRNALDAGYFPCADNEDSCRYCRLAEICG
ncbi:MAG: PD-(D/E)XK nuclease family protein, partial [Erysipelotrichaceae bacterium]|nr:PD-(D/E)XK nuclease family protein [Erysipelotrichaceae bacterium]